jgi:hypothetical protein
LETLLKKPDVLRDQQGRFERHGKELSKTSKKGDIKITPENEKRIGEGKPGPGRPPGSPNKTTLKLKEMILQALNDVGGSRYLAKLATENSSAFSSLLGKVLPATLAAEPDGGNVEIRFVRQIVYPNGHTEIEGVTPKQLPKPDDYSTTNDPDAATSTNDINKIND